MTLKFAFTKMLISRSSRTSRTFTIVHTPDITLPSIAEVQVLIGQKAFSVQRLLVTKAGEWFYHNTPHSQHKCEVFWGSLIHHKWCHFVLSHDGWVVGVADFKSPTTVGSSPHKAANTYVKKLSNWVVEHQWFYPSACPHTKLSREAPGVFPPPVKKLVIRCCARALCCPHNT